MLKLTYINEDWRPMITIADKLYDEACVNYHDHQQQRERGDKVLYYSEKPLLYYFGYSQLTKGLALQKLGRYQESRACIEKYRDLSWMERSSDFDYKIINDFKSFAIGNTYTLDLLEGREEVLPLYVDHISRNKEDILELLAGIITLLEAALKNNFQIDGILEEFAEALDQVKKLCHENSVNIRYFTEYFYLYSLYQFKTKKYYTAFDVLLDSLSYSVKFNDNMAFKKNVAFYETLRQHAERDQNEKYGIQLQAVFERVLQDEVHISLSSLYDPSYR
ncbi:hypothetical protein F4V43_12470 [Paenibacillus spiritus]|uniref:DNA-binding protein n=2 Tax=Paenibacillus TaxID=44249 RepID=A0A5J5G9S5_9BACL|nr:hypothetical protein [Paenibacillus spiritus]KAA9004203.1 hypothetical protein F4V43_12470 [Paenibacillus spiritus]